MVLPGEWKAQITSPDGSWVYLTRAGNEQVTIRVIRAKEEMDLDKQKSTLRRIVDLHRQASAAAHAPHPVKLTDPTFVEASGDPWATYAIFDVTAGRFSTVRAQCSKWTVATVMYEHKDLDVKDATQRSTRVLGSFMLTGAPPL